MGRPDIMAKEYMRRPDIFADVFNKFIYRGEQVILPEQLVELDTAEIAIPYGADNFSVPSQRYRDVSKMLAAMTDGTTAYCIMAVENEAKLYSLPMKSAVSIAPAAAAKRQNTICGCAHQIYTSGRFI